MKSPLPNLVVIAVLLLAASFCPCVAAADWGPLSRAQALEQAKSGQIDKRRLAYGRLAEVGTAAALFHEHVIRYFR